MEIPGIVLRIYSILTIGSFLLYLVERFTTPSLESCLFRLGVKVRTFQETDVDLEQFEIGKVYETNHARLKRVNRNSCFFYYRQGFFQINTPFPIRGEVSRDKSGTLLIWRIPLGSTIFFSLVLLGWVIPPLIGMFQLNISQIFRSDFIVSILATLAGVVFMWFLYAGSSSIEQKRARLAISELDYWANSNSTIL
jgi:hypothetical protein